mgnify:CR=1 FL=1
MPTFSSPAAARAAGPSVWVFAVLWSVVPVVPFWLPPPHPLSTALRRQTAAKSVRILFFICNSPFYITAPGSQCIRGAVFSVPQIPSPLRVLGDAVTLNYKNIPIRTKTIGQKNYINALKNNTVTICIGPAGTGKTYLAVAYAAELYRNDEIERIILSRPAIEAGEKLGFLPGDLQEKVDPYLKPLYDALNDVFGPDQAAKLRERGIIEVAPLAYMRGRTLNNSMIIIDESQNATLPILKMALTRIGVGSKMILTGDVTQIDLSKETDSGLQKCASILKNVDDIATISLTNRDVVRCKIVKDIVKAFEKEEAKAAEKTQKRAVRRSGRS